MSTPTVDTTLEVLTFEQTAALPPGRFLTPRQLADWLEVPLWTVQDWRDKGVGPRPVKRQPRHLVRYSTGEVMRWLCASRPGDPW